jgi:hypothetical protein
MSIKLWSKKDTTVVRKIVANCTRSKEVPSVTRMARMVKERIEADKSLAACRRKIYREGKARGHL